MSFNDQSADEILDRAMNLSGRAREEYLDAAVGARAGLRQHIEALIEAHEAANEGKFLDRLPVALAGIPPADVLAAPIAEKSGDSIGRYKLRERIGQGGCGTVYVAEQETPVRRRVALKVIKLGMDTRQVIARFEAERQALALMDHPNISKVLDAGATETGRPYFVMEFVRGINITDYCNQNNLSTEERLKLFVQVCNAVQHAHQKGIIHRDIKPSNILVTLHDGVPVPKVIDFGIAKATVDLKLTDKTIYTAIQQFVGTPAYMSPEQSEMSGLDIDTRSDIYSLGVLLYELLAGSPPFDPVELIKSGFDAMRRTIREVDPPRPSTRLSTLPQADLTRVASHQCADALKLIRSLRGDLDWIVMKALEKDRRRRYENVSGFAQDIQHYLANEMVIARPPSSFYRFRKLVRRNKVLFVSASAVAIALLVGLIISTWLYFREKKARGQSRQRQLMAETQLVRLTDRSAGWSQRAWSFANAAARIRTEATFTEVRNQAAATLAGLDAQRVQQFTNFGASSVVFDSDGRQLLMGSLGDTIHFWDGSRTAPFAFKNSDSLPVAFASHKTPAKLRYDTNRFCFVLSNLLNNEVIHGWNLPQQITNQLKGSASPKALSVTTDGEVMVAAMELSNGNEAIVAFRSGLGIILDKSPSATSALTVSIDGRLAASADDKGQLKVWSLVSGKQIASFSGGRNEILCLALKLMAHTQATQPREMGENMVWVLAAGDSGGNVTIYDVQSHDTLAHCRGGEYQVHALAFSPDGTTLVSGGRGPVKVWDVATGKLLLDIATGDYITGLDFSPDGLRLAVSTEGITCPKNVSIWNLDDGRGIRSLRGLSGQVSKVCFSSDGRRIAALSHKWELGIWDISTGKLLRIIEAPEGQFADNAAIALDSTGEQVAFSAWKKAKLWTVATGVESKEWDLSEGIVDIMAFIDRGHLLSFRMESWQESSRVCYIRDLFNQNSGTAIAEIRDFSHGLFTAALSADGHCLVVDGMSSSSNERHRMVKAYDTLSGKKLWAVPSDKSAAWGVLVPDATGKFVAMQTTDGGRTAIVDSTHGVFTKEFPSLPCAFSDEADLVAFPGEEHGLSLCHQGIAIPAVALGIDQPAINAASFDPNANELAWGNSDGTVTICNLIEINSHLATIGLQW